MHEEGSQQTKMSRFLPPDGVERGFVVSKAPMGDLVHVDPERRPPDRQHQRSDVPTKVIGHTGSCHLDGLSHTLTGGQEGVLMRIGFRPKCPNRGTRRREQPWSHRFERARRWH